MNQHNKFNIKIFCEYCKDFLCYAIQTICKHLFCQRCLDQYLLFVNQCPTCQVQLRNKNSLIHQYLKQNCIIQFTKYQKRIQSAKNFKDKLKIHHFTQGMKIDLRDNNYIWIQVKVEIVFPKTKDNYTQLIVSQCLTQNSKKLVVVKQNGICPLGTYTNRKEIPHYYLQKVVIQKYGEIFELTEWNKSENTSRIKSKVLQK